MAWYVLKGDAHWDDSTWWEVFGELHTGGIWLKKLSDIAEKNGNKNPADLKKAAPDGRNLRTTSYSEYSSSYISGKPADSKISKYFFLPALGRYDGGQLTYLGSHGCFWSSSANPIISVFAYYLYFDSGSVRLNFVYRNNGFVAQPFE